MFVIFFMVALIGCNKIAPKAFVLKCLDKPQLSAAIERNDPTVVLDLIKNTYALKKSSQRAELLSRAIQHGSGDVASIVLSHLDHANRKDAEGNMPLHLILSKESKFREDSRRDERLSLSINILDKMYSVYKYINDLDSGGYTPLGRAVEMRDLSLSKLFIERGSNVNKRDVNGILPLELAIRNESVELVDLLIKANAQVKDSMLNLSANEQINNLLKSGRASKAFLIASYGDDINEIKDIVSNVGYDITNDQGETLLHKAISTGNSIMFNFLVESQQDLNARDKNGEAPIHVAVRRGYMWMVKQLINKNALVNIKNEVGNMPIHCAASIGDAEMISMLLVNGANTKSTNNRGWTPFYSAAFHGHGGVCRTLAERGANIAFASEKSGYTALHRASFEGHIDCVKELVNIGVDIFTTNSKGDTPYNIACAKTKKAIEDSKDPFNYEVIAKYLLEKQQDSSKENNNKNIQKDRMNSVSKELAYAKEQNRRLKAKSEKELHDLQDQHKQDLEKQKIQHDKAEKELLQKMDKNKEDLETSKHNFYVVQAELDSNKREMQKFLEEKKNFQLLISDFDKKREHLDILETKLKDRERRLQDDLKLNISTLTDEQKAFEKEMAEERSRIDAEKLALSEEENNLKGKWVKKETDFLEKQKEMEDLVNKYRIKLQDSKDSLLSSENKMQALIIDVDNLNRECLEKEREYAEELEGLKDQGKKDNGKILEQQELISSYRANLIAAKKDLNDLLDNNSDEAEKRKHDISEMISSYKTKLKEQEGQVLSMSGKIDAMIKEIDVLKSNHATKLKIKEESWQKERASIVNNFAKQKKDIEAEERALQMSNDNLSTEIESMKNNQSIALEQMEQERSSWSTEKQELVRSSQANQQWYSQELTRLGYEISVRNNQMLTLQSASDSSQVYVRQLEYQLRCAQQQNAYLVAQMGVSAPPTPLMSNEIIRDDSSVSNLFSEKSFGPLCDRLNKGIIDGHVVDRDNNNLLHIFAESDENFDLLLSREGSAEAQANILDLIIENLTTQGKDINSKNSLDRAPLHIAAYNGAIKVVKELLSRGANINLLTKYRGVTPLIMAVERGHNNVVKLLLSKGASVDLKSEEGHKLNMSAIMWAAHKKNIDLVELLLSKNSNYYSLLSLRVNKLMNLGEQILKACVVGASEGLGTPDLSSFLDFTKQIDKYEKGLSKRIIEISDRSRWLQYKEIETKKDLDLFGEGRDKKIKLEIEKYVNNVAKYLNQILKKKGEVCTEDFSRKIGVVEVAINNLMCEFDMMTLPLPKHSKRDKLSLGRKKIKDEYYKKAKEAFDSKDLALIARAKDDLKQEYKKFINMLDNFENRVAGIEVMMTEYNIN